jgi:hypothetical protein
MDSGGVSGSHRITCWASSTAFKGLDAERRMAKLKVEGEATLAWTETKSELCSARASNNSGIESILGKESFGGAMPASTADC